MDPDQALQAALQHHRAGRLAEAEVGYRRILGTAPKHADALHLLGLLALQTGHATAAVGLIADAVAVAPGVGDYLNSLGNALGDAGRYEEAVGAYQRAIAIDPNNAGAINNLGNALKKLDRVDEAVTAYSRAIAIDPALAHAHNGMAAAYIELSKFDNAIASARKAIAADAGLADAWNNLGAAMEKSGRIDESIEPLETAVRLAPNVAAPYLNLATSLTGAGRYREGVAVLQCGLTLYPELADAHLNLGLALLLLGDLPRGFAEFEWRWKCDKFLSPRWKTTQPQWRGEPVEGRTILLHAEQGLGDSIQFVRYAKLVAAKGARVWVMCAPEVAGVLASAQGVERVICQESSLRTDLHCPMLSLPLAMGTRLETIPAERAYLHADAGKVDAWKQRLGPRDGRVRVGLVWAGNPGHKGDRRRSVAASQLLPLTKAKDVAFYSLQKGQAAVQAAELVRELSLIDMTNSLTDFSETAALIENLDLVITVDTSVAHLAAAIGKPTWILLAAAPDWRWMLDRDDSPWYPTVRLFRQRRPGDWGEPIERAADALVELAT